MADSAAEMKVHQRVGLVNEVLTSNGLLWHGLASVQAMTAANDFYHMPMLLLSSGLERLGKCILILRCGKVAGRVPTVRELKGYGHSLRDIVDSIIGECFNDEYRKREVAREDESLLRSDQSIARVVAFLGDFGRGGRYSDLDTVCGGGAPAASPEQEFQSLETDLVMGDPDLRAMIANPRQLEELCESIARLVVVIVARIIRALARLFTLGPLGDGGRQVYAPLSHFLHLSDRQLGTTDYRRLLWVEGRPL